MVPLFIRADAPLLFVSYTHPSSLDGPFTPYQLPAAVRSRCLECLHQPVNSDTSFSSSSLSHWGKGEKSFVSVAPAMYEFFLWPLLLVLFGTVYPSVIQLRPCTSAFIHIVG